MLDGWYCRSMANQQSSSNDPDDNHSQSQHITQQQQHHILLPAQHDGHNAADSGSDDDSHTAVGNIPNINPRIDYKGQYNNLKKKLKFLLYVSVCFFYVQTACT